MALSVGGSAVINASSADAQEPTIDNVTVWAQRHAAPLQDVPMAMSTLTAADLANTGIDNIDGVALALPALDLQTSVSPVTSTLRIRRVGSLGNIPTFEPAVGLFVDGAFRSRSLLATGELLDVERIEVLSGPQSTLYGKNVSAGVIAVYTRKPTDELTGNAEMTGAVIDAAGSPAWGKLQVGLSGPLATNLGGSIAAAWSAHGHTFTNALPGGPDGNDESRTTLRGQLLWSPDERLQLRLIAGYMREQDDQGESDVYLAPGARSTTIALALQQAEGVAPCPDNVPHNRTSCSVATNGLDLESADLTLLADYRFANGWTLSSVTGWDRYQDRRNEDDAVQLFAPLLFFHDSEQGTSLQQELHLTSAAASRVSWLAGLSWYRNEYQRGSDGKRPMFGPNGPLAFSPLWPAILRLPLALPGQMGIHDSHLDTEYYSAFGQISWPFGEHFSVTGALRRQEETKHASVNNSVTEPGASVVSVVFTPSVSPGGAPVNGTLDRLTNHVTWSLTPEYRFNDNLLIYATAARGFKSGGFNTGFGNAPLAAREFADETSDHYEFGTRTTFAGGRARLSASVFHTRYHNYQDAAFIASQFSVGNARRVDLRGVELEGRALLGLQTVADVAVSFADLTYAANTTGMCYPGRIPDGSLPQSCDLSGEHPIDAPPWAVTVGVQHTRPVSWGELSARLDWSWTDTYNTSFSADPRLQQGSWHAIDVRLGAGIGDRYEIVLWGDNLLDEKVTYIDSVLNLFNDASYQSYLGEPRTYGLTLRARF
ncbi:MAG TPA: TonB-dependent receptor [Povalibacter sp.]|nr:TonB-dependent receptor [Povalibacter sp.]